MGALRKYDIDYDDELFFSALPKEWEEQPVRQPKRQTKTKPKPKQKPKVYKEPKERYSVMTPVFALYTTVALGIILFAGIKMLAAQTMVSAAAHQLKEMESDLLEIREDNTRLEAIVNADIDFDYVYMVATKELGLVEPEKDSVIYYEPPKDHGYVRQDEVIK